MCAAPPPLPTRPKEGDEVTASLLPSSYAHTCVSSFGGPAGPTRMTAPLAPPTAGCAFVVDDHPLVARGIAEYLTTHCRFAQAHTFAGGQACLQRMALGEVPELAVVDFWLPEGAALPLLRHLADAWPQVRLLAVSGDEDDGVRRTVAEAGVHGYLRKNVAPDVFAEAVAAVRAGRTWWAPPEATSPWPAAPRELPLHPKDLGLTERQGEVLALVLRGLPNKRIARALALSEPTVKEHISNIFAKLGVANRVEAITQLRGRRIEQ